MSGPTRRPILLGALAVAAVLLLGVVAAGWDLPVPEDLAVYRDAAERLLDSQPLYPPGSGYAPDQPLPFTYPPFAALVLLPTALLPTGTVVALEIVLSFLCLWWIAHRSVARLVAPLAPLGRAGASLLAAGTALALLTPISSVFAFGQIGLLLGALCLRDLDIAVRRSRATGALVGLAAAIKISPGTFVLTYVAARRWRAVLTTVVTVLGCWGLTALALPGDTRDWLGVVLDPDRVGPVGEPVNTSWNGLVLRLLGPGILSTVLWLVLASATLAVAAIRSARALDAGDALTAATVMGLGIVLAAPVSWSHHIVWVLPLIGLVIDDGRRWRRWLLALGIAVVFSTPGMYWLGYDLGTPELAGVLDWFWVNTCVLVMAAAVVLLPVGVRRSTDAAPVPSP